MIALLATCCPKLRRLTIPFMFSESEPFRLLAVYLPRLASLTIKQIDINRSPPTGIEELGEMAHLTHLDITINNTVDDTRPFDIAFSRLHSLKSVSVVWFRDWWRDMFFPAPFRPVFFAYLLANNPNLEEAHIELVDLGSPVGDSGTTDLIKTMFRSRGVRMVERPVVRWPFHDEADE